MKLLASSLSDFRASLYRVVKFRNYLIKSRLCSKSSPHQESGVRVDARFMLQVDPQTGTDNEDLVPTSTYEGELVQLLQDRREERRLKKTARAHLSNGNGIQRSASPDSATSILECHDGRSGTQALQTRSGVLSIKRTASESRAGFCLESGHHNFELNMCVQRPRILCCT